jgi:hypothetical protein
MTDAVVRGLALLDCFLSACCVSAPRSSFPLPLNEKRTLHLSDALSHISLYLDMASLNF